MVEYFEDTEEDIVKTEEDEEDYKNNNICRFCEKCILVDKVRDHSYLTDNYRTSGHIKCKNNVYQKQSDFIPFVFHIFSIYDCYLFFNKLVNRNIDKVIFDVVPKSNEEKISVKYGCIRFFDSYPISLGGLDSLVTTLNNDEFKNLKKVFPDKWQNLSKKLV